jgi:hypothetical protein
MAVVAPQELGIGLLDPCRVGEHDRAEIARRMCTIDRRGEALGSVAMDEGGEIARVVDVGVGEDEHVDLGGVDRELPVDLEGLLAPSLIESAIEQDTGARIGRQQVHRAGDRLRGPKELDCHGGKNTCDVELAELFIPAEIIPWIQAGVIQR